MSGHVAGVPHAVVLQVTSQRHEAAQVTPPLQLEPPLQVTWQAPGPHITPSSHELVALHSTTQLAAWEQSTRSQSLALSHRIVQSMPAGHVTTSRHRLPPQSMVHSA